MSWLTDLQYICLWFYHLKVKIGPNTAIRSEQYALIRWGDGKKATKELAVAVFGRHTLATHSVTGRTSTTHQSCCCIAGIAQFTPV